MSSPFLLSLYTSDFPYSTGSGSRHLQRYSLWKGTMSRELLFPLHYKRKKMHKHVEITDKSAMDTDSSVFVWACCAKLSLVCEINTRRRESMHAHYLHAYVSFCLSHKFSWGKVNIFSGWLTAWWELILGLNVLLKYKGCRWPDPTSHLCGGLKKQHRSPPQDFLLIRKKGPKIVISDFFNASSS